MKIKLNDIIYDASSAIDVVVKDGETAKVLHLRPSRVQYYADRYGDGECVCLNTLVSASLGKEVALELVSDKAGLRASQDDLRVSIDKIKAPKPPKKKKAEEESPPENEE